MERRVVCVDEKLERERKEKMSIIKQNVQIFVI